MLREKNIAEKLNLVKVKNEQGPELVYAKDSGVGILEQDGLLFKDHSKDGKLDKFEDWRLSPEERAKDLVSKLSVEQMAGLMLYSDYNVLPTSMIPMDNDTYFGEKYDPAKHCSWEVTDNQYDFMANNYGRHILIAKIQDAKTVVNWNNGVQYLAESMDFAIPVNTASDPRHTLDVSAEYNMASGGGIAIWPEAPGLAATFEPELARDLGRMTAEDYRAMGISTMLGPQMDVGTELRWFRYRGTFGQSPELSKDFAKAYCEGLQTSEGGGWGNQSVNAIVKHWPGGGTGEGGRDAHFDFGKYAVYPGNNFEQHLYPFTEGAFKLDGGTQCAGGVMPYYTISFDQDTRDGENVGNAFSHYIVNDLLRERYGFNGVVCTDWKVTQPLEPKGNELPGRCWGMEKETESQRHLKGILCGVDQFGGNNFIEPMMEAYKLGCAAVGEAAMKKRIENSVVRILTVMFRLGLFENPYVEEEKTVAIMHSKEHKEMGYQAQVKSVVMVKNKGQVLPAAKGKKIYIPQRYVPEARDWFGGVTPAHWEFPANKDIIAQYFEFTDNPDEADLAFVPMNGPDSGFGFEFSDIQAGGNGFVPVSLQYGPYTANSAREKAIAGGDRSYRGKTIEARNKPDLDMVLETRKLMGDKPVIAAVNMVRPCMVKEFESVCDALFLHFGVEESVFYDLITGVAEPSGLLPAQVPANMDTVELHCEDVPFDMECHVDSEGHVYDFAYGMNWSGVIDDERVRKYKK